MSNLLNTMNKLLVSACAFFIGLIGVFGQKANLVIPMGHAQKINQILPSHDFRHMISVDGSNVIHIWDTETEREIFQFRDHEEGISSIDLHNSKDELVSADANGIIMVWDYLNSKSTRTIDNKVRAPLIKYTPDQDHIVAANRQEVKIWNIRTGELKHSAEYPQLDITALDVSPYSGEVAIGGKNSEIIVLDAQLNEKYFLTDDGNRIFSLKFIHQNTLLAGDLRGNLKEIDLTKGEQVVKTELFHRKLYTILYDEKNQKIVVAGNDPKNYVLFLDRDYKDRTPGKFKIDGEPKDNDGIKAIGWADAARNTLYISNHDNVIRKWSQSENDWVKSEMKSYARSIHAFDMNSTNERLAFGTDHRRLKLMDLTGSTQPILLEGHSGGIVKLDFHPAMNYVLTLGRDSELRVWDIEYEELVARIKKVDDQAFNVSFTSDKSLVYSPSPNTYRLYNFETKKYIDKDIDAVLKFNVSPDGSELVFQQLNKLLFFSSSNFEPLRTIELSGIKDFSYRFDEKILILSQSGTVTYYDNFQKAQEIKVSSPLNKIVHLSNGEFLLHIENGTKPRRYYLEHYAMDGSLKGELRAHSDYITDVKEHGDNLLTGSMDGTIRIWKLLSGKYELTGTLVPLNFENYVAVTPANLFDATPGAMNDLHFTRGADIISFQQVKDVFYEPNLLSKLLGYIPGELRKTAELGSLGIHPEIEIKHPNLNDGKLGISLTNQGGGIGRVVLTINGKEVSSDVRAIKDGDAQTMGIEYDINGHPYMFDDKVNKITIKAYNKDGNLASEPKNILVLPSKKEGAEQSKIFAIIVGTSTYGEESLNLKYAAKDANDFAAALEGATSNLIGGNNLNMTVLTTDGEKETWPTKENIKKAFEKYSLEAKARDYLVVYLAGHGTNTGGEQSDFYYLTCTATKGEIRDEKTRVNDAISSTELTEYIKRVPAIKQVMIVDACHSGTLTSALGGSKAMDSEEIRAFERMKDRTGLFLLAGSAADAVSYETSMYGQGLLTYALLFGMKGAALKDGELIDVLDLFQFAAQKVPQLAKDIGGIQKPEVRVPRSVESFPIGKMTDEDKAQIKLLSPKPIYVHSNFQDDEQFVDAIGLSQTVDKKLQDLSQQANSALVYMNENKFSGAYEIRGRYHTTGGLSIVDVKVFLNGEKRLEFKVDGTTAEGIADKIIARLLKSPEVGGS